MFIITLYTSSHCSLTASAALPHIIPNPTSDEEEDEDEGKDKQLESL